MSEKLIPCPICGSENTVRLPYNDRADIERCKNCNLTIIVPFGYTMWNTRPIEDALRKRIAELKGMIEILEDQQREAKNILIDKNLHIDSLYEEGYKLQQRIAELEGKIDQLTAHSDIERQDDKSSNDTQSSTIVYRKEREE